MDTFNTPFGLVTLYRNEAYIREPFIRGSYWDIDTLTKLREYIDPNRNILEIGGHCGTSTLIYSHMLESGKIYVYEPQRMLYKLLLMNILQNDIQHKVICNNVGVFCYEGDGIMNDTDLGGMGGNVTKRYTEESNRYCNFGGIGLGDDGEKIKLTTIDAMNLDNVGFIHCDAQGSENFIFSKGIETIKKYRPFIYYENMQSDEVHISIYEHVCKSYPQYVEESKFDIKKFCMEELKYSRFIDNFNGGIDTLLIP